MFELGVEDGYAWTDGKLCKQQNNALRQGRSQAGVGDKNEETTTAIVRVNKSFVDIMKRITTYAGAFNLN